MYWNSVLEPYTFLHKISHRLFNKCQGHMILLHSGFFLQELKFKPLFSFLNFLLWLVLVRVSLDLWCTASVVMYGGCLLDMDMEEHI